MDGTEAKPDEKLWDAYWRGGKRDADRNAIFEYYLPLIERGIRRMIRGHKRLRYGEVLSEVAERLLTQAIPNHDADLSSPETWLDRHITGAILEMIVRATEERELFAEYAREAARPIAACDRRHDPEEFEAILSYVKPRTREILRLYYRDGLDEAQTGERLGVTESRISQILTASRKFLKQVLKSKPDFADIQVGEKHGC